MARAGAFLLIVATAVLLRRVVPGEGLGLAMALGFSLIAAGLLGEVRLSGATPASQRLLAVRASLRTLSPQSHHRVDGPRSASD